MKLKQIELAQLAVKLFPYVDRRDGAQDSVKLALQIWEESGNVLNPKPAPEVEPTHMGLDDFLRSLMPKASLADRTKAMRDFVKWELRGGLNPTGMVEIMETNDIFATERKMVKATDAVVTRLAETRMETLRKSGVHNAPEMQSSFKKWRSLRPKTPSNKTEVPTKVVKPEKKPKKP
jgi:hypothetical protein